MPAKTNPSPKSRELYTVAGESNTQRKLREDFHNTIEIHKQWPLLERLLLSIQRDVAKGDDLALAGARVQGVEAVYNAFELFARQGERDIEFIKK